MKGTIDVQIKHKDGSIETRHEHNVVFDIPALTFKKVYESPLAAATGVPTMEVSLTADKFSSFCLSEDTISITEPQYVPPALVTTIGSSDTWYQGPSTAVVTAKSKALSATWTVQSAMTLRSIFFRMNSEDSLLNYRYLFSSKDNIDIGTSEIRRLSKSVLNFSGFSLSDSTIWNGLVSGTNPSAAAYEDTYVDYPLCNPDERFVCSYLSGGKQYYTSSIAVSNATLEIRNKDTNTIIRTFPSTQFTGFRPNSSPPSGSSEQDESYRANWIVNTGTKNVLIQPTYGGKSLNIWQIPDEATSEPIPITATVLEDQCNYATTNAGYLPTPLNKVIGPYISLSPINQTNTGSSRRSNIVRVNDDFSIKVFSGYSNSLPFRNTTVNNYHSGRITFWRKCLTYGSWTGGNSNNGIYAPISPNLTAANFSTPIELAEGDVLTVSYKIEVA